MFSPPAWGWSAADRFGEAAFEVLPTRVGMVRLCINAAGEPRRSPHPRGDGPVLGLALWSIKSFSPPAWGWSGAPAPSAIQAVVLPTRVGMVRTAGVSNRGGRRSPHPRGDGPVEKAAAVQRMSFSPPAWGWPARRIPVPAEESRSHLLTLSQREHSRRTVALLAAQSQVAGLSARRAGDSFKPARGTRLHRGFGLKWRP